LSDADISTIAWNLFPDGSFIKLALFAPIE
jgi:hypothetical protein